MPVLRAGAVVIGPREARVLRSCGLRGWLETLARTDGRKLATYMVELLADIDEAALSVESKTTVESFDAHGSATIAPATVSTAIAARVLDVSEQYVTGLVRKGERLTGRKRRGGAWEVDVVPLAEEAALRGRPWNYEQEIADG